MNPIDDIFFGFSLPFHVSIFWMISGGWVLILGIVGFFMLGIDKGRALDGQWRISEVDLLFVAYMGGFWGILLGTEAFHHKTSKVEFMALAMGAFLLWFYILWEATKLYGPPIS